MGEYYVIYKADEILSVTSYDGKITYVEGKDYELKDGQIVALEGTSIPCITSEVYYGADSSSLLMTKYNGKNVYTYWGEATAMTRWQVCVTYTHSDTWEGYTQETQTAVYQSLIQKLKDGEHLGAARASAESDFDDDFEDDDEFQREDK